jgi:3D (Asp-Asp-Asp) domain-containing protein
MFIARSLRRKIIATLVAVAGFFVFHEATIFDSRFATRQVQSVAPAAQLGADRPAGDKAAADGTAGTDGTVSLQPAPVPMPAMPALRFVASAYCKGETTASGVVPRSGIAAADDELLPVGSVIQVSSLGPRYDGVYTIMDTGPKVQGRHIDIYLWSCTEAVTFGRRAATVVVLRLGWSPRDTAPTLVDRLLNWGQSATDRALPKRKR